MENRNRAWIYCRIDAPEDTHGALKNQRRQLMDYANQMGFEIVGCSEDTASGLEFGRPGLNRFIETAKQGDVDFLIIRDLSRVGRSTCEAMEYLNQLEQMGVSVYSPLEGRLEFTMQNIISCRKRSGNKDLNRRGKRHGAEKRNQ